MSEDAKQYVQELVASPLGKSIPQAQRSVLRVLAWRHRLEVNCAWPSVPDIATEALMSPRSVQRALKVLEARGLILRHEAVRKNGSTVSYEYELPGMKSTAVTAEMRQQVFKTPRQRIAMQMDLSLSVSRLGVEDESDANGSRVLAVDRALENEHNVVANEEQNASVVGQDVCENLRDVSPPPVTTGVTPPGDNMVSPLEESFEDSLNQPLPPPCLRDKESAKAPINAKTEAKATASANATATTPVMREAEAAIDVCDGMSERLGTAWGPDKASLFYGMSDKAVFAAALQHEVELILLACGIASGNSTRRQRKAVLNALCEWMASTGKSMETAGNFAVSQWRCYLDRSEGFVQKMGIQRFFAGGSWLQDWTSAAYRPRRNERGFCAAVGMYRPN